LPGSGARTGITATGRRAGPAVPGQGCTAAAAGLAEARPSSRKGVTRGRPRPRPTMQALYYDRDAKPVSREQWQQLGCQPGYSRVGYADGIRHGRQVTVITFWSGIAASGGPGGPLIFCTCAGIRGLADRSAAYQRRWGWPTLEAARAGHEAVTAWIDRVAAFLAGATSRLPAPDPPGTPASQPGRQALTGLPRRAAQDLPGRQARRSTPPPTWRCRPPGGAGSRPSHRARSRRPAISARDQRRVQEDRPRWQGAGPRPGVSGHHRLSRRPGDLHRLRQTRGQGAAAEAGQRVRRRARLGPHRPDIRHRLYGPSLVRKSAYETPRTCRST
jgi:hypothetical protein